MIRGTTAQFKFKMPYAKDAFSWITVKFWQPNNPSELLPITKTKEHCGTPNDPKELCISLTAEETARFSDKYRAQIQLRALHTDSGTILGNRHQLTTVYPMNDGIIEENPILPVPTEEGVVVFDGETVII